MAERLIILAGLGLVFLLGTVAVRAWARRRSRQLRAEDQRRLWSALGERPDGRPAVVVFSSPACVACRTVQEPAVQQLAARTGDGLRLIHLDIGDNPTAARVFRVLTAPSTAVFSADGRLQHLNQGFAPAELLRAQLSVPGGAPPPARSPEPPVQPAHAEPAPAGHR